MSELIRSLLRAGPACAAALLAVPALAQGNVWLVDQLAGPGTDFTTITGAVAAASDGDLVLIKNSGSGYDEHVLISGKGLTLAPYPGFALTPRIEIKRGLEVANLAAQQRVVIEFANLSSTSLADPNGGVGLIARDCDGTLHCSNCSIYGYTEGEYETPPPGGLPDAEAAAHLERCADAVFANCKLYGGRGVDVIYCQHQGPSSGAPALEALDSSIVLHGSHVQGGSAGVGFSGPCFGGDGGAGLAAQASTVFAAGSTFIGGTETCGTFPGRPGPAIAAQGASAFVEVASCSLHGGPLCGTPSPDTIATDGAQIVVAATPTAGFKLYVLQIEAAAILSEGEVGKLRVYGPQGAFTGLLFGAPSQGYAVPGLYAPALIAPPLTWLALGVLPAGGMLELAINTPDQGAGVEWSSVHGQALLVLPSQQIVLGAQRTLTLVDAAL